MNLRPKNKNIRKIIWRSYDCNSYSSSVRKLTDLVESSLEKRYYCLLSFLVPLVVRAIPEVVSFPWPLGYDTVTWYAPVVNFCQIYGPLYSLTVLADWRMAPLLYMVMGVMGYILGVDPLLMTKIFGPLLSGCLGFSVFYFSKSYLGWSDKKSLACALFCTSYFVTLRLTWDSYRNVLGLIFFVLAVAATSNLNKRWGMFFLFVFSFLCAFSHELVTIVLLLTLTYLILLEVHKKLRGYDFKKEKLASLFVSFLPPTILLAFYYTNWLGNAISYFYNPLAEYSSGGILVDYISLRVSLYLYPTVDVLNAHIIHLFAICFAPILPLAVLGYFRNEALDVTTLFLLVGSFMPLVLPHSALPLWSRWMLMLTIPFTVYATNLLFPDNTSAILVKKLRIPKLIRTRLLFIVIPLMVLLSSTYMVLPWNIAFPYFSNVNTARYLPSTMQYNTVPVSMSQDIVLALSWMKFNMPLDSCIIAHESLAGWASLAFPFKQVFLYSFMDVGFQSALLRAKGFGKIYVLTIFPYDFIVKDSGFKLVFRAGLVEVFINETA